MADLTNSEQTGLQQHLAFIGRILSLYTHELKNHLAIINESAGLLGDIVGFSEAIKDLPEAKQLSDIVQSIDAQIKRSSEMAKYLNSFGHRMDKPLSSFDINECVEEVLSLLHRFIAQKRITFKTGLTQGMQPVTGNPAKIQLLVYMAIQGIAAAMHENNHILIKTFNTGNAAIISITAGDGDAPVGELQFVDSVLEYCKPVHALTKNGNEISISIPGRPGSQEFIDI
ncbi:MAG: hypothetical protein HQL01_14675 [Nitrospirae bacterium]|nr:hypothetical protein [Nitrospirota bacterium]